jgi:DNA-binding transcriptional LysR family regulator
MVISAVQIGDPNLEAELLFQEELFLVSAAPWRPTPGDLVQLAALPWIVTGSPNAIRGRLNAIFTQADLEPNIVAEINSMPMVIRAVQRGLGVTLLPQGVLKDALSSGSVVVTAFPDPRPMRNIHLYRLRDRSTTPAETVVYDLVLAISRGLQASAKAI